MQHDVDPLPSFRCVSTKNEQLNLQDGKTGLLNLLCGEVKPLKQDRTRNYKHWIRNYVFKGLCGVRSLLLRPGLFCCCSLFV